MASKARYIANFIIAGNNIANSTITFSDIGLLFTSNVNELGNLYYTNARVFSNVSLMSIDVLADVDTTGKQVGNTLVWNGSYWVPGAVGSGGGVNLSETANVANTVVSISNFTTANLAEGSNLYFTNARALAAVQYQDLSIDDLFVAGNLTVQGNVVTLNTATVIVEDKNIILANGAGSAAAADGAGITIDGASASLTYVYSVDRFRFDKNVDISGNQVLTTASSTTNLPEGSNLYFSNARVAANVSLLSINALVDVDTTGAVSGNALVWNGTNWVPGTVAAGSATASLTANFANLAANANLVLSLSNFTTSNLTEGVNLYYTNARVWANITGGITTSYVPEGSNLYYTNARVRSAITAGNTLSYNSSTGNITMTPSGVTPGVYGNSTIVPVVTVDQFGRVTNVSNINITASVSGGGGSPTTDSSNANVFTSMNGIFINSANVTLNYTIGSGYNGLSAGPITISANTNVIVSAGSFWTII